MKFFVFFLRIIFIWFFASGFVFEHNPPAKIDVSPENPIIYFHMSNSLPPLEQKETLDPLMANLDDSEFWPHLFQMAADYWNRVEASYIEIHIASETDGTYDETDKKFSFVESNDIPITAAADALPTINKNDKIVDCDIRIPNTPQIALNVAYTLIHEIGHCLGIGHNHIDKNSIMSYNTNINTLAIGIQDMAALIYLYPDPAYNKKEQNFAPCGVIAKSKSLFFHWYYLIITPLIIFLLTKIKTNNRNRTNRDKSTL